MDSHDTFLRRSLQLDGVASGATGVLLLVAAGPVSTLMGNAAPGVARLVGGLLVVYALLNIGWVVGSLALILLGPLTVLGRVAVAAVALAVLGFTVLEIVGLRRLREA